MKPLVIKSYLLSQFDDIVHGISTRVGSVNNFNFNLGNFSNSDEKLIQKNREAFFKILGIDKNRVVYQQQVHSDKFLFVNEPGLIKENDALITNTKNLFLVVTVADCIPILFYDAENKIVGVVHSGWRGTYSQILLKTVEHCKKEFNLSTEKTYFYFGPSICKDCFEVDEDVAVKFDQQFVSKRGKKFLIDLPEINKTYLVDSGFSTKNIHISKLCTFEMSNLFHSYRRDKEKSGRMFGVIGLKSNGK